MQGFSNQYLTQPNIRIKNVKIRGLSKGAMWSNKLLCTPLMQIDVFYILCNKSIFFWKKVQFNFQLLPIFPIRLFFQRTVITDRIFKRIGETKYKSRVHPRFIMLSLILQNFPKVNFLWLCLKNKGKLS